ncbi:hypothetical protein ES708_25263 [subsurface metagenome]
MAAIDIGAEAKDRGDSLTASYTLIAKDNPANASGKITSIEIWAKTDLEGCEVATFFVVSGDNLSTRDTQLIGDIVAGDKRTFEVDLDVEAGDYIGVHCISGTIEVDTSGGAGLWYYNADYIPCTNQAFSSIGGYIMSLKGIGAEAGIDVSIEPPLIAVNSEGKTPAMSLGVGLEPPLIAVNSQALTTTFVLDRIFGVPLVAVNSQALIPSLSISPEIILAPVVSIDSEASLCLPLLPPITLQLW